MANVRRRSIVQASTPRELEHAMTCQIASVLSALLVAGSAQAAQESPQAQWRAPAPVQLSAQAPKNPVHPNARAHAVLKAAPKNTPESGPAGGN